MVRIFQLKSHDVSIKNKSTSVICNPSLLGKLVWVSCHTVYVGAQLKPNFTFLDWSVMCSPSAWFCILTIIRALLPVNLNNPIFIFLSLLRRSCKSAMCNDTFILLTSVDYPNIFSVYNSPHLNG